LIVAFAAVVSDCCIEGAEVNASIEAYLQAGDFTAALAAAGNVEDVQQRNTLVGHIAQSWVARRSGSRAATAGATTEPTSSSDASADRGRGAEGGGAQADFDTLMNLIKTTIEPESWDDVGGEGSIMPFPGGVYVDATGELQRHLEPDPRGELERVVRASFAANTLGDVRQRSTLRKISLPRLERHVQQLRKVDSTLDEEARFLAGLQRIEYVLVDVEGGDLVIAGPAGDWWRNDEGRTTSVETGRPTVQLDDLVVMLRHAHRTAAAPVGCSINPRPQALTRAQAFLRRWEGKAVDSRRRNAWLAELGDEVGAQEIEIFGGIDPGTRVARVMVEADYRMKLVGMGLEGGAAGVPSYLDLVAHDEGQPSMDVLRWWFAVNYDAITTTAERRGYALHGQGVEVLSENELLTRTGQQIHTGKTDPLNREFAQAFTDHFDELAEKYPVYADLQNVFDLALVAALIRAEHLAKRAGWSMPLFAPEGNYEVRLGHTPREVETVVAHRVVGRRRFIAGVSGGVMLDVGKLVDHEAIQPSDDEDMEEVLRPPVDDDAWWWD
jgi:hypothetical protein